MQSSRQWQSFDKMPKEPQVSDSQPGTAEGYFVLSLHTVEAITRGLALRARTGPRNTFRTTDGPALGTTSIMRTGIGRDLRTDISNLNTEMGTLMSIMCLCVYENVVFSQPTAWLLHYDGLGRLMQARGPKPWRTPAERQILQAARYYITLSAGHQRRHCFLDQPQWESTRCLPEGETPDKIDILYDIFAQPPGIVADYDNIRNASVTDPVAVEVLRNRTQSLIDKLHEWYRDMPWVCTTDPFMRENCGIPLPDDPMECVALAISYAMILCLVQPCEYLGISLFPENSMEGTSNIDQDSKNKFLALEICRFANWALRGQASASYALLLVYPLQIAWFCVQNSEEDLRNVRVIMNSVVADSYGFELGRMRHWDETSLDQGRYGFLY
ncbi:hypothetical protein FMEXI_12113 [Fusarium mexicanum]|uniref:Uncharacterized protein n=1 Tax=Fusarium mexicanum TaxID=751941 RepID=A0A8H5IBY1_9HYPO|nr:hypothetical protein FMEXI_12113 [Fusarium mexicanum]